MPLDKRDIEKAALQAGYSEKTAYASGRRLLTNSLVQRAILERMPKEAMELAVIDSAWMLRELANLWETPLGALFEDGRLRPIDQMPEAAQKLIAGFEITELTELDDEGELVTSTRVGKIKLIDRLRALEDIGKHTKVRAFDSPEEKEIQSSFAQLLRAATAALPTSTLTELDITPKED